MTANILFSPKVGFFLFRETTGNQSSHHHCLRHARAHTGRSFSFSIKQREESIQTVPRCYTKEEEEEEEEGRFLAFVLRLIFFNPIHDHAQRGKRAHFTLKSLV